MKLITIAATLATATLLVQDTDEERAPGPKVGEKAPAFRLNDHTGRPVSIGGESKAWTVVAFFPKAMTPG